MHELRQRHPVRPGAGIATVSAGHVGGRGATPAAGGTRAGAGPSSAEGAHPGAAQALSLLHSTLEASPDAVGAYDLSDRLIAYNQCYLQLWQLSPEMIETTDPSVLRLHLESQVTTPERLTMWSDDVYGPCVEVTRMDGRLMDRRARPKMLHGSQVGVVFHWHDITGRRRDANV
jgi:PAS domain-containing protein